MNFAADRGSWDSGQTPAGYGGGPFGTGGNGGRGAVVAGGQPVWGRVGTWGQVAAAQRQHVPQGGGFDQIGATVTGTGRDGVDNRRVARPTVPRRAGSWSSRPPRTAHTTRDHFFSVSDPGGRHRSPEPSRLTSASPAGSSRRLRQRRSCRDSTSRSPGAGRSARYLLRAARGSRRASEARRLVAQSELLGGEHARQQHRGHQPRALLVLGQLCQPVALEQDT
jgi:hypothetical protein